MDNDTLRLECLRLARETMPGHGDATLVIESARAYADFVLGAKDAEVIAKARELADAVRAN